MIDEEKLRKKLHWLIRPFKNSFNVPPNLTDKIVSAVHECEVTEEPLETAEEEAVEE